MIPPSPWHAVEDKRTRRRFSMEMSPLYITFIVTLIVADVAFLGAVTLSYLRSGNGARRHD
jgi:hypothetical protein